MPPEISSLKNLSKNVNVIKSIFIEANIPLIYLNGKIPMMSYLHLSSAFLKLQVKSRILEFLTPAVGKPRVVNE